MAVSQLRLLVTTLWVALLLSGCGAAAPLLRPNGVAVAADGSLFVMDRGNYRVVHLAPDGAVLGAFGQLGKEAGDIHSGWDLVLDSQGLLYICNHYTSEDQTVRAFDGVKVFSPEGQLVREIGRVEYPSDDSIPGNRPYGLDIDSQDRVFVADYGTNLVRVFNRQGALLATLAGAEGNLFSGLNDVAVDDARGLLYAVDAANSRIQQFQLSADATSLTHRMDIGTYGRDPGQLAHPQGLLVDERTGHVYVSDMANRRIQSFDSAGNVVQIFAPPGQAIWQVLGMGMGPDGAIYATDAFNSAIWVFEPNGQVRRRIEVAE